MHVVWGTPCQTHFPSFLWDKARFRILRSIAFQALFEVSRNALYLVKMSEITLWAQRKSSHSKFRIPDKKPRKDPYTQNKQNCPNSSLNGQFRKVFWQPFENLIFVFWGLFSQQFEVYFCIAIKSIFFKGPAKVYASVLYLIFMR